MDVFFSKNPINQEAGNQIKASNLMEKHNQELSVNWLIVALICFVFSGCDSPQPKPNVPTAQHIKNRIKVRESKQQPALTPNTFPGNSRRALERWFEKTKKRKKNETYGELLSRIASTQLHKPYLDAPQTAVKEVLTIPLETFQCVSLVEASLALANCTWQKATTPRCFAHEVQQSRYRDGEIDGYASRLHYFFDWLSNNADRGRLKALTQSLGGQPFHRKNREPLFSIMTDKPGRYPALLEPTVFAHIQSIEEALNTQTIHLLRGHQIAEVSKQLQNGDIIAVVTTKNGLLISHTGFVMRTGDGMVRFLHASSFHKRVVLTQTDIADYIQRDPKRLGILVYRPIPSELSH